MAPTMKTGSDFAESSEDETLGDVTSCIGEFFSARLRAHYDDLDTVRKDWGGVLAEDALQSITHSYSQSLLELNESKMALLSIEGIPRPSLELISSLSLQELTYPGSNFEQLLNKDSLVRVEKAKKESLELQRWFEERGLAFIFEPGSMVAIMKPLYTYNVRCGNVDHGVTVAEPLYFAMLTPKSPSEDQSLPFTGGFTLKTSDRMPIYVFDRAITHGNVGEIVQTNTIKRSAVHEVDHVLFLDIEEASKLSIPYFWKELSAICAELSNVSEDEIRNEILAYLKIVRPLFQAGLRFDQIHEEHVEAYLVFLKELNLYLGNDDGALPQLVVKENAGLDEIIKGSKIKPGALINFVNLTRRSIYKGFFNEEVPNISIVDTS